MNNKIEKILSYYSLSDIIFIIACTLMMSLPASYEPNHFAKILFTGAFIQSLSYSIIISWITKKTINIRIFIIILLSLIFYVETYSFFCFGSRLNPGIMTLILQTTPREIIEFIHIFVFSPLNVVFLFIGGLSLCLIIYIISKTKRILFLSIKQSILIIFITLSGLIYPILPLPFPSGQNTINELILSLKFVKNKHKEIYFMKEMINKIQIKSSSKEKQKPIIIFIIGESHNKHHSSLYGYSLNTSPRLKKEADKGNLIVFNNAMTPTNGTAFAMRYIFTLKDCNSKENDSLQYVLMPAVFKKAGYKVYYFDNQYTRSSGGELDYSCAYFLNPTFINDNCFTYRNNKTFRYDAEFIEYYRRYFCMTTKSINIIHLMGQHFDAAQRYPKKFDLFKPSDIKRTDLNEKEKKKVAEYDNATLYNDYVVYSIIDAFKDKDAVIIYISDHGEQIYDSQKHYYGRSFGSCHEKETIDNVYSIPFMIWCSNNFIENHKEKFNNMNLSTDKQFCVADIPYLLFDLADLNSNFNNPTKSIINSGYSPHEIIFE